MRTVLVAVIALCLLSTSAPAQGTFPLEYREATTGDVPALDMASRAFSQAVGKPPGITGLPADLPGDALYYRLLGGAKPLWAVMCGGSPARLYLDTDGDNDLSDEKALSATAVGTGVSFGVVSVPLAEKGTVSVRATSHSGADGKTPQCLHLEPVGYRTGEVRLGERSYRVALIDSNLNGRYDEVLSKQAGQDEADALVIDLNGDGRLEGLRNVSETPEWSPLSKARQVGQTYYRVSVAADGSQVQFEKTEPTFGKIDLGPNRLEMTALSDVGFQKVEAADGKARLPAGLYLPLALSLTRTDDSGAKWKLQWKRGDERLAALTIPPDETLSMPLGPPLVAGTTVRRNGRSARIDFTLTGRAGEQYSPAVNKNNAVGQPPSLEIVDEAGKVLQSGKFEYG